MEFAAWLDEDWNQVGKFVGDLPWSLTDAEKKWRDQRKANKANRLPKKVEEVTPEQVEEAKNWFEKLKVLAEQGRKQLETTLMEPESSLLKQLNGEEAGEPVNLLLKRAVGYMGKGLAKILHFFLVKVLHLPSMYKFFRKDVYQIGKDFLKSGKLAATKPDRLKSWGAFGYHILNLVRLPIAALMTGIGAKLVYQQYQLIHAMGFTSVNLSTLSAANIILCWLLFVAFLVPHWFHKSENSALKSLAKVLRNLFPQQMYKDLDSKKHEAVDEDHKLLIEDISRYSVEVNYRTSKREALDAWAKLVLGFVSAALNREGYHVKHVYSQKPLRILVSTNNWDDGSWTALLSFNDTVDGFVLSSGFWNKNRRTVSVHNNSSQRCAETTAATLVSKMLNYMHQIRKNDPRPLNTFKHLPMKPGPKK